MQQYATRIEGEVRHFRGQVGWCSDTFFIYLIFLHNVLTAIHRKIKNERWLIWSKIDGAVSEFHHKALFGIFIFRLQCCWYVIGCVCSVVLVFRSRITCEFNDTNSKFRIEYMCIERNSDDMNDPNNLISENPSIFSKTGLHDIASLLMILIPHHLISVPLLPCYTILLWNAKRVRSLLVSSYCWIQLEFRRLNCMIPWLEREVSKFVCTVAVTGESSFWWFDGQFVA